MPQSEEQAATSYTTSVDLAYETMVMDFAGPFMGRFYLVVVDAYSKWPEVIPMVTTPANKTIIELRKIFHELPEEIITGNGAQFISELFEQFLWENGIKYIRSAPYHPFTNGEAERFVQRFKNAMKAAKNDSVSFDTKLARFLIMYRSTPNTTTGESPAGLLFHRQLRTRLSLLTPSVSTTVDSKQTEL